MLESFEKLNEIVGPSIVADLKKMATMYRRHARIIITVLHVMKSPNERVVVQVEQEADHFTDFELAQRVNEMFTQKTSISIIPYIVVKEKGAKFALSQLNEVIVGYAEEEIFIASLSFEQRNAAVSFEFDGFKYWLIPVYGLVPSDKRLEQAAKYAKRQMIVRKEGKPTVISKEQLETFFKERPAISPSAISLEAGFANRIVRDVLNSDRSLTHNVANRLLPILKRYGYDGDDGKPIDLRGKDGDGFSPEIQ